jgi:hypothetical protein
MSIVLGAVCYLIDWTLFEIEICFIVSDNHFVIEAKTPETEGKLVTELEGTSGI